MRTKARKAAAISALFAFAIAVQPIIALADAPVPLLKTGTPVDWWFMFKLNAAKFPNCNAALVCPFGGDEQSSAGRYGLQFVFASSQNHHLVKGTGCAGESVRDPLGATYNEIYNGDFSYVIWNDQFYDNPHLDCSDGEGNCPGPWGHSKGMIAWDSDGNGIVLQVTTPDWPGAGSTNTPRPVVANPKGNGNTLGCITDNDILYSQHFFALKLTPADVAIVLKALANASVATNVHKLQVAQIKPQPAELAVLASGLGSLSASLTPTNDTLSSGVIVVSKPQALKVPPWQMLSSVLGGVSLRAATWWGNPNEIDPTAAGRKPDCWSTSLTTAPGAVDIAQTGVWDGTAFSLKEGSNHAKIGVSTGGMHHYAVFGDMNQQGALNGDCTARQNDRGGLFFVMDDAILAGDIGRLIGGDTGTTRASHVRSRNKRSRKAR